MKPMLRTEGFALPTVIVASLIMLTVLVTSVTAVGSITTTLSSQYYNQLAREAAESGLNVARACFRYYNYNTSALWRDSQPLKPNTDCGGGPITSPATILSNGNIRSTFSVAGPTGSGALRVVSTGTVQLVRASNSNVVWRTYTYVAAENIRYNDLPQIAGGAGWKSNGHDGYMLAANGTLYGWGDNSGQQLGDSSLGTTVSLPVKISFPSGVNKAKKIVTSGQGASILCILATNDTLGDQVYCRGVPGGGENGLMPLTPGWYRFGLPAGLTALGLPSNGGVNGYGADSMCIIASDNQAYCAGGIDDYGGFGTADTNTGPFSITSPVKFRLDLANPGPVSGSAASLTAVKVYNQDVSTCVIASDNQAYCAGENDYGELGRGNLATNLANGGMSIPGRVLIPGNLNVTDIVFSYHYNGPRDGIFFHVIDSPATDYYMSGHNGAGTANDGSLTGSCPGGGSMSVKCYSTPRQITFGAFGRMISVGEQGLPRHAVCAIASDRSPTDGGLWCTGANSYGQLGASCASSTLSSWTSMLYLNGETALYSMNPEATYQMNSVMVMTTAGNVYAAGDNTYGKLGTGAALGSCNSTFSKVSLPAGVTALALANNDEYTAYILGSDGKVYAMGRNNNGQLGNGTTTDSNQPVEVQIPRQETIY